MSMFLIRCSCLLVLIYAVNSDPLPEEQKNWLKMPNHNWIYLKNLSPKKRRLLCQKYLDRIEKGDLKKMKVGYVKLCKFCAQKRENNDAKDSDREPDFILPDWTKPQMAGRVVKEFIHGPSSRMTCITCENDNEEYFILVKAPQNNCVIEVDNEKNPANRRIEAKFIRQECDFFEGMPATDDEESSSPKGVKKCFAKKAEFVDSFRHG